jgi:oxygen-independent coproporphyrinogen-3 oxidase
VFHVKRAAAAGRGGFGLYVHWPFCESKCPYCDFNSHVGRGSDTARWSRAFRAEIARTAADTGPRVLASIFFGGGTPSLMDPRLVAAVIEAACAAWTPADAIEVTLEANPGSVEAGRFRDYRAAGVGRISLGVQALDDAALRRLGRRHSAAEARRAAAIAAATFARVNLDLIYARQGQGLADWAAELAAALALGAGHLSLYQLTVEPGTVFAARQALGQLRGLPDEETAAALFEHTQAACEAAGLPAYELSNHARPGAECRHNLIYWTGGEYAGIGPGAHGRIVAGGRRLATEALRQPEAWLAAVEARGCGELPRLTLSAAEIATEALLMGLRLREGLPLDTIEAALQPPDAVIAALAAEGLVEAAAGSLRITGRGRLLTDRIVAALTAHLA